MAAFVARRIVYLNSLSLYGEMTAVFCLNAPEAIMIAAIATKISKTIAANCLFCCENRFAMYRPG